MFQYNMNIIRQLHKIETAVRACLFTHTSTVHCRLSGMEYVGSRNRPDGLKISCENPRQFYVVNKLIEYLKQ
jgi:hypothetical protein